MEWISVKDRLPEKNKEVIFWDGEEMYVRKSYYAGNYEEKDWCYSDCCGCVATATHWTPLPEQPKKV